MNGVGIINYHLLHFFSWLSLFLAVITDCDLGKKVIRVTGFSEIII